MQLKFLSSRKVGGMEKNPHTEAAPGLTRMCDRVAGPFLCQLLASPTPAGAQSDFQYGGLWPHGHEHWQCGE